jgi:hypothetical protein
VRYADSTGPKPVPREAVAVAVAAPRSAPNPSASVNVVSLPTGSWAVCTTLPPELAASYWLVSVRCAAMSWYPSLPVPL